MMFEATRFREHGPTTSARCPAAEGALADDSFTSGPRHDGKISRDEFRGRAAFSRVSTANKDGYVTREEHESVFSPPGKNR